MKGYSAFLKIPALPEPSSSDCLMSYLGHLLERGSYSSVEMQLVYSTAPVNWAID